MMLLKKLNKINQLQKKIIQYYNLIKKPDYNTKISEIESKIPSITGLATTSALTAVENKIASVSNLVKKTDYNTKITEIEKKLNDHDNLNAIVLNMKLAQANLVRKTDFDNKLADLNRKIVSNKTRDIAIRKELKKLNTYDLSYFRGKSYFDEDGTQNWFVFQPVGRYLELAHTNNISYILSWKSKGLSDLRINSIKTSNYLLNPYIDTYDNNK